MGKNNTCSIKPMVGLHFGRWHVVKQLPKRTGTGTVIYECVCECGTRREVNGVRLRTGESKSCGCLMRELTGARARALFTTHGHTRNKSCSGAYKSWTTMRRRCLDKKFKDYARYGGKGITVCNRWRDSFETFFKDMGDRPKGMTLDRKNPKGNYEPANCRWANHRTQMNNTQKNRFLTLNGQTMTVAQWGEVLGIPRARINARLNTLGWSVERALLDNAAND